MQGEGLAKSVASVSGNCSNAVTGVPSSGTNVNINSGTSVTIDIAFAQAVGINDATLFVAKKFRYVEKILLICSIIPKLYLFLISE